MYLFINIFIKYFSIVNSERYFSYKNRRIFWTSFHRNIDSLLLHLFEVKPKSGLIFQASNLAAFTKWK